MTATQHTCHTCPGAIKPRTRSGKLVCPTCGGTVTTRRGVYAVIAHRGDGRYKLDDADATRATEKAAERIRATFGDTHVVRFLPL